MPASPRRGSFLKRNVLYFLSSYLKGWCLCSHTKFGETNKIKFSECTLSICGKSLSAYILHISRHIWRISSSTIRTGVCGSWGWLTVTTPPSQCFSRPRQQSHNGTACSWREGTDKWTNSFSRTFHLWWGAWLGRTSWFTQTRPFASLVKWLFSLSLELITYSCLMKIPSWEKKKNQYNSINITHHMSHLNDWRIDSRKVDNQTEQRVKDLVFTGHALPLQWFIPYLSCLPGVLLLNYINRFYMILSY